MTPIATKNVIAAVAGGGIERGAESAFNPTSRTIVVGSERDLKIRKALWREARRLAFRLQIRSVLLRFQIFAVQSRCLRLKMHRDFSRRIHNFRFDLRRHARTVADFCGL